jgi:carboxyl-terminal processing protease
VNNMPRRNFAWLLGIAGVSLFCWAVAQGSLAPPRGPLQFVKGFPGHDQDYERLSLLLDVLQQVEQGYVHELSEDDRRKFMESAIQGGLQSLDLHSGYMNAREYRNFLRQNDGGFGGIGVQIVISRDTKRLTVVTPVVGTPAYEAGIKPGDEIEKIEGVPTQGMSTEDAVDRIQGPPGTKVNLTIRHRGSDRPIDLTLTRSVIEVQSVMGDQRDAQKHWDFMIDKQDRVAYIRLTQFNRKSEAELRGALEKVTAQGVRGVILDLRNNPGGLLEAAVGISDLFLTEGKIVSVEGRARAPQFYEAKGPGTFLLPASQHPVVVLVNEGSASASEIVAAALQDHGRATVIGERSYGKGSVQNLIPMEKGKSALKLTTAKYIRPSGKNIHRFPDSKESDEWGVQPDIEVKLSPQEELELFIARRDRDIVRDPESLAERAEKLAAAIGPLARLAVAGTPGGSVAGLAETAAATREVLQAPRPFQDKVLQRALDYLHDKLRSPAVSKAD